MIRHFSRHLHATIQDQVEQHLIATGWLPAPGAVGFVTLFGALPVTFQRQRPDEETLKVVEPNLVTVSFGGQTNDEDVQMGGGVVSHEHIVFADVYAENDAIAVALASDIRDLLAGRTSAGRFFRVRDHSVSTKPVIPDHLGEYEEVFREPADRQLPTARWQIVRATALIHLPGGS